jgi:hypothetical protein
MEWFSWVTPVRYPDDFMVAWPVGARVNAPKINDAKPI